MNKFFLFLIFYFSFFFTSNSFAKTLHAILVADTIHEIRSVTQSDLNRWQKELRIIAQHTKMALREKIFCGRDFNKEKIKHYLNNLSITEQDSVIFYFSGHGYRTTQKISPWPYMTFEFYKPGLDIQWVVNVIKSKNPQFALVMSDCCNNFIELGLFGHETKHIKLDLKKYPTHFPGYLQLFCRAKGCIVISSCSVGQFSYGSRFGGLYTQCFFNSLNFELLQTKPSWKNLLLRVNSYINHIQRPICEVYR